MLALVLLSQEIDGYRGRDYFIYGEPGTNIAAFPGMICIYGYSIHSYVHFLDVSYCAN